jgi:hypothetical protein
LQVAVVVVSVGDRPWWPIALTWLDLYCRKCSYDLVVIRQPLATSPQASDFDRFQTFGRAQKLGIGRFFKVYDRIIQMDDTCLVSPATPPLADIVPEEAIGCWVTGPGNRNFKSYAEKHQAIFQRAAPLADTSFYNSGVAVYSRKHAVLFDEATIPWEMIRADKWFGDQGYLSDQSEREGFALHDLGTAFNLVGRWIAEDPSTQVDSVFIFHLTSVLSNRVEVAKRIDRAFREKFPDALAGPVSAS